MVTNALRRDVASFVGRHTELERIVDSAGAGRVVSIHTIDGMPGVGKTALVIHAAHQLADRFPDGRYMIELNAHTPGQSPADPADVLARLLTGLGIDPRFVPDTLQERRDLWLDRITGKRVLLVLDDAQDHAQVQPLLPTGGNCLTLITSRRRLIALERRGPPAVGRARPRHRRRVVHHFGTPRPRHHR
ncbi:AAA family ATPase [Nocardia pseudovaccinii]|uniref:AAA family ATPase n=1 Tax=Nocardia pseudovaccinii TaxID=189540 RepID=UPI003D9094B8